MGPVFISVSPTAFGVSPAGVATGVAAGADTLIPMRIFNGPYRMRRVRSVTRGGGLGIVCSNTRTFSARCGNRDMLGCNSVDALDFRTAGLFRDARNKTVVAGSSRLTNGVELVVGFNVTDTARVGTVNVGTGVGRFRTTVKLYILSRVRRVGSDETGV